MSWLHKIADTVPLEPGTTPIPDDHIRLFHYFPPEEIENVRTHGIDISRAKGEIYGEPNAVWGSGIQPSGTKTFVEFSVSRDDPGLQLGRPYKDEDIETIRNRKWDVTFNRTIKPEEFIAIHEPWHNKYRYMLFNPELIEEAKQGDFDDLLDDSEYGPAIRRFREGI